MNTKTRVVLLSAELAKHNAFDNAHRTEALRIELTNKGYKFVSVLGSYKGKLERSFMVDASEDVIKPLHALANSYDQESILVVDEMNKASLMFNNGETTLIGEVIPVETIDKVESWTFVNGQFFTVK